MSSNNYVGFGLGFTAEAYYRATAAGAFNAVNADDSCFAAYCTFMINPAIQAPGGVPVREYLWGNSEDASFSGWSLELEVVGGELVLQAKVGDGSAYTAVQEPITGAAVAATGQLPMAGAFGRLIQALMYLDGTNLVLVINGTIANYAAFDPTDLAPSALAAGLGAGTALVAALPATYADIIGAGYSSDIPWGLGSGALLAGAAFAGAQEGNGQGYIDDAGGTDWTHRYYFGANALGLPGTISKTAAGVTTTGYPQTPATLTDLGGQGRGNLAVNPTPTLVDLARGGNSTTLPILNQRKQCDWAVGGTFFYTP